MEDTIKIYNLDEIGDDANEIEVATEFVQFRTSVITAINFSLRGNRKYLA